MLRDDGASTDSQSSSRYAAATDWRSCWSASPSWVQMMLGPYGHAITLASSGEEALVHLATAPFDLVLSDLGLGDGMNGWDLLDVVHERFPGTRFILSTGWGAQIDPLDVVARGGEGLLPKPYRLADLLRAIAGPA